MVKDTTGEIEYYDTINSFRKANDILYEFDTDITYRIFIKDKRITNAFVGGGRYDEVKKCIISSLDNYSRGEGKWSFNDFFDYDDDKTVFSYILFQTLYNKENLYVIYNEVIEEIHIVSHSRLPEFINQTIILGRMTFISKILLEIKNICSCNGFFGSILDKYDIANKDGKSNNSEKKIDLFIKCLEDIKNVQFISEEFKNCRISLNIKDGDPFYMEAETKTANTDFKAWKEKLGNERKIEENTHDNKSVSLKVTKKFRYGKGGSK